MTHQDPLRDAWWSKKCPYHINGVEPCQLSYHIHDLTGPVKRVACWRHGTLVEMTPEELGV